MTRQITVHLSEVGQNGGLFDMYEDESEGGAERSAAGAGKSS